MTTQWKIDFLVPTFNRPKKLHHLLTTGLALNIPNARFVVIDDGSQITEDVPGLGIVSTETVYNAFKHAPVIYLKSTNNIGLAANITNYYAQHCAADYTMLMTDKDQFVDAAPIIHAIQQLDDDPRLSMVVTPIRQNDNEAEDQLLTFDYPRMSGSQFIKSYINDTTLQHCIGYSIVRVTAVKRAGVPRSLNLRAVGLEDSFGFDLDFFLMIAATGDVGFEKHPHVCRTILAGLTERFPLSFAYCYYQYAKRTLKELRQKKVINRTDVRKSTTWWNLIMLRGAVIVYQPSNRRTEIDTSRIKQHLKIPVLLYFLLQYIQYQIWPTAEMKKLLRMHVERCVKEWGHVFKKRWARWAKVKN